MAREVKYGIILSATDKAGAVIRGIGAAAKGTTSFVRSMAEKGAAAFKGFGVAAALTNQTLNLAKKAMRAFDAVVGDTVRAALDFRGAHDLATQEIHKFARGIELTRARLGDALIPIIAGVGRAMAPVLTAWQRWLTANRQVIASKILEWGMKVSNVLIKGVAFGALQVARAWAGWKMIVGVLEGGIAKFFEVALDGSAALIETMAKVSKALGMEGTTEKLTNVAGNLRSLANEWWATSDKAMDGVGQTVSELDALEAKLGRIEQVALQGVAKVGVAVQHSIEMSTAGISQSQEEQARAADNAKKRAEDWHKRYMSQLDERYSKIHEVSQAEVESIKLAEAAAAESAKAMVETGAEYGRVLGDTIGMLILEKKTAEESILAISAAMISAILDTAERAIQAYAAQAAAGAAASQAAIPGVGPVLAATAAAAVFGMVRAYLAQVGGMAEGGVIKGGVRGKDSVLFKGQDGERVLTTRQTASFDRLVKVLDRTPASQTPMVVAGGGSRGGDMHVTIVQQNRVAPDRVNNLRLVRDIEEELVARLKRRGFRPA